MVHYFCQAVTRLRRLLHFSFHGARPVEGTSRDTYLMSRDTYSMSRDTYTFVPLGFCNLYLLKVEILLISFISSNNYNF
jgi:hypothetical protein